jgi:hypothetical protein
MRPAFVEEYTTHAGTMLIQMSRLVRENENREGSERTERKTSRAC